MRAFKNSNSFDSNHGPGGSGSHGPGYGGGGSNSNFHGHQHHQGNQGGYNQGNQGGYNQQSGQGGQQQQQSGYQSHPKQLNSGQYHVFTTSLCKRDQKLHKRVVNVVEPEVPHYLRWSEQPIC